MKISCLSDLDRFRLSKNGNTYKDTITKEYYVFVDSCSNCKEPFMQHRRSTTSCCSLSCAQTGDRNHQYGKTGKENGWFGKKHDKSTLKTISNHSKDKNNPAWKGGVISKNLPLYDTYSEQIGFIEEIRPVYKYKLKLLEIKCKKCGNWFIPSRIAVRGRLNALNNIEDHKESNFYCSNKCKHSCSLYNSNGKGSTNVSYNYGLKVWSKEVLKRADYKCEYCGRKAKVAHHEKPKKLEPIFILDPDNGIACCYKCHNKYGHRDECSYIKLANIKCSNK